MNPFLADLIEAKLTTYDLPSLRQDFEWVLSVGKPPRIKPQSILPEAPPTIFQPGKNGRWVFDTPVAQQILALSAAIDYVRSRSNRRFLRVILGSVLTSCSNVVINGKGRRYRRRWENRTCDAETVVKRFRDQFGAAVGDVERFGGRPCRDYTLIRADSRKQLSSIECVDLAIFSPPYPNSFDYTDIYNLELWMLGYLRSRKDNECLRKRTLRSHVQIARSFDIVHGDSPELDRVYQRLVVARSALWNRHIPEMVTSYFCDLLLVLLDVHSKLRSNGRMFIAVGSSKYAGVRIDVPKILVELGKKAGLTLVDNASIRSMRSSAQQGGRKELSESVLVFC